MLFASEVPKQVALAGYRTKVFYDDFTSLSTIDTTNSQDSGFNWYIQPWFGNQDVTSSDNINIAGSILTLGGGTSNLPSLVTGTSTASTYQIGTAFGGGAYFEARIAVNTSVVAGTNSPAFWGFPIERIASSMGNATGIANDQWPSRAAGYEHFGEIDVFELLPQQGQTYAGNSLTQYTAHDHSGLTSNDTWQYNISNQSNNVGNNSLADLAQFHTYGALWVPANGTTPGYVKWYFDGQPANWNGTSIQIYYLPPTGNPPLPGQGAEPAPGGQTTSDFTPNTSGAAAATFAILDQRNFALAISTDNFWPVYVDWVKVWQ